MEQILYCYCVSTQHVFPNSLVTYLAHSSWALLSFQNDLGTREDICNSRRWNTASLPSWHLYKPRWMDERGTLMTTPMGLVSLALITEPEIRSACVRVLFLNQNFLYSIWIWGEQEERTWWPRKALTAELLHFAWHVPTHWPLDCT